MNSHHYSPSPFPQDQFPFDPWSQSLAHLNPSTFGAYSDLHSHIAYQGNALGLASGHREEHRGSDRMQTSYISGSIYDVDAGHQNGAAADSYTSNSVVAHPFSDGAVINYNGETEDLRYHPRHRNSSSSITGQQNWEFSGYGSSAAHRVAAQYPSHSYQYFNHSTLSPNLPNVNESSSAAISQLQGYDTTTLSQHDYPHQQMYSQSSNDTNLGYQQNLSHLVPTSFTQPQLANSSNESSIHAEELHSYKRDACTSAVLPDNPLYQSSSAKARRISPRGPSPVRRKPQVQGWSTAEPSQSRERDSPATASGSSRAVESTTNHNQSLPRASSERKSMNTRQRTVTIAPAAPTQSILKLPTAKKANPEKKQTLACLFCRERKIACGRPPEGSTDDTCNQCARRHFKCEYPKESRRGQHKRNKKKTHSVNDAK